MTTINFNQFLGYVRDWARLRDPNFKYYWPVKGGWEGWVQVDLTAYILTVNPTEQVLREQPIYTNNYKKVDLLLNADQDPDDQIAVELKAQSFENRANFIPEVVKDLDKFAEVNNAYRYTTCVMLAIPFNEASLQELLGLEMDDHPIFQTIHLSTEVAIGAAVWTAEDGWIDPNERTRGAKRKAARGNRFGPSTTGFSIPEFGGTGLTSKAAFGVGAAEGR